MIYRNTLSLMIDNTINSMKEIPQQQQQPTSTACTQTSDKLLNSSDYDNFDSQVTENLNCSMSSNQSSTSASSSSANEATTATTTASLSAASNNKRVSTAAVAATTNTNTQKPSNQAVTVKNAFSTINVSAATTNASYYIPSNNQNKFLQDSYNIGTLKRQKRFGLLLYN